jgi:hypothetical protein
MIQGSRAFSIGARAFAQSGLRETPLGFCSDGSVSSVAPLNIVHLRELHRDGQITHAGYGGFHFSWLARQLRQLGDVGGDAPGSD